ncbi:diguanylate cyclase [Phytophthora cinnamomi]|uniref:diguanylate cyclase n=1 Tax=Phytophthora cinnamomi TaxID=4785 RepID=UPI00355A8B42|nr:diguanylate cyclase [Phytophthora cinnamomi]
MPPHPATPGLSADPQNVFPGAYILGLNPMDHPQQTDAMEEYTHFMGKRQPEREHHQLWCARAQQRHRHDPGQRRVLREPHRPDLNDAMGDGNNVASKMLPPARLGSGRNGILSALMYNPSTWLAF